MASLPNFTSIYQVRTYLNDHRDHLSMVDITNACALALDPGFIQRDAIASFVQTLSHASQQQVFADEQHEDRHDDQQLLAQNEHQHPGEDGCPLCCGPYAVDPGAHYPVALPCGHVIGASCLKKSLQDDDTCFECGATVFTIPASTTAIANPEHEGIIRGLVQSGGIFLEENSSVPGSDKCYAAFCRWAYTHSTDHDSIMARLHAKATIRKLDISYRVLS